MIQKFLSINMKKHILNGKKFVPQIVTLYFEWGLTEFSLWGHKIEHFACERDSA